MSALKFLDRISKAEHCNEPLSVFNGLQECYNF